MPCSSEFFRYCRNPFKMHSWKVCLILLFIFAGSGMGEKTFIKLLPLPADRSTNDPWTQFTNCDDAQGFIGKLYEGLHDEKYYDNILEIRRECGELCAAEDRGDCWEYLHEVLPNCTEVREGILEFQAGHNPTEINEAYETYGGEDKFWREIEDICNESCETEGKKDCSDLFSGFMVNGLSFVLFAILAIFK